MDISVDVGGTFTDLVIRDDAGRIVALKSPTTPGDVADGVMDGLRLFAEERGVGLDDLLAGTQRFAFGTTAATNAILEAKAARTALLTTEGFRDTLLIREGGKDDSYNIYQSYPPPYVPRALTFEIVERVSSEGEILTPLSESSVRAAIEHCREADVRAIAVSLLWSIANPEHERRVGELIESMLPGMPFSLGHRVNPCIREYRRTSATAIDASLKPIVGSSVRSIESRLEEHGFKGTLSYVTSNGGQTSSREIVEKPVYLCFSGPSAAPESGRRFAEVEGLGDGNVVTVDMGGTSFDVTIVTGGTIPRHREGRIAGHVFGVPSVEVHTIGAGGGSIARVDNGGFVHVGPESAGASPGPACYGQGGNRPTVTDANLVGGFLCGRFTAGGGMALSAELARDAVREHIASPLGILEREAAALIRLGCEQNMVVAIEDLTIKRGVDPREYVMVAGGAAAGLHAVAMARELGIRQVIVPPMSGVLSAFGILTGDVSFNFGEGFFASTGAFDHPAVDAVLSKLEGAAREYLTRMGFAAEHQRLVFSCEARYTGQVWQLTLELPHHRLDDASKLGDLVERFHELHESVYSVRSETDAVEITEWNVQAIGLLDDVVLPRLSSRGRDRAARPSSHRRCYLRETREHVDVPVLSGTNLPLEQTIEGPLLVDDALSTLVVDPGATVRLSPFGSYLVELTG